MYDATKIADRIKGSARARGTTVKALLDSAGVNWNFMSSTLRAGSMPKVDTLARIADQLECSVDYLVGRTDKPEVNK